MNEYLVPVMALAIVVLLVIVFRLVGRLICNSEIINSLVLDNQSLRTELNKRWTKRCLKCGTFVKGTELYCKKHKEVYNALQTKT